MSKTDWSSDHLVFNILALIVVKKSKICVAPPPRDEIFREPSPKHRVIIKKSFDIIQLYVNHSGEHKTNSLIINCNEDQLHGN